MIYPLVVSIVAFSFAWILLRQFLDRKRPYQLVWTWSLALGGLAGLFFVLFLAADRNVVFFKLYYVTGALLMAAYLGLGSVYLLAPRRIAHGTAIVVAAGSVLGIILIFSESIHRTALHASSVEAGQNVIAGPAVALIAALNTFGAVAVIGGAIYSAWQLWRRQGPLRLLAANGLIATGTLLASAAGSLARLTGNGSAFWLLLALGFLVLFGGFLLTTVKPALPHAEEERAPVLVTS